MAEEIDIHVAHGIGYIQEFNGVLNIGAKDKFEPMIDWLKKDIPVKVKNIGKRYAPNVSEYHALNVHVPLADVFNYFDSKYVYMKILSQLKKIVSKKGHFRYSFTSFERTQNILNDTDISQITSIDYFIDKIDVIKKSLSESIKNVSQHIEFDTELPPPYISDYEADISNMNN